MFIKVTPISNNPQTFFINSKKILYLSTSPQYKTKYTIIQVQKETFHVIETPEEIINQIKGN